MVSGAEPVICEGASLFLAGALLVPPAFSAAGVLEGFEVVFSKMAATSRSSSLCSARLASRSLRIGRAAARRARARLNERTGHLDPYPHDDDGPFGRRGRLCDVLALVPGELFRYLRLNLGLDGFDTYVKEQEALTRSIPNTRSRATQRRPCVPPGRR
jgi:hypothetical protein